MKSSAPAIPQPRFRPLDAASLEAVHRACATYGLEIVGARRRGVILELLPRTLDALPDPMTLQQLADALCDVVEGSVRYVTLALEEPDDLTT